MNKVAMVRTCGVAVAVLFTLCGMAQAAETAAAAAGQRAFAQQVLEGAGKEAQLTLVEDLAHPEAYRVVADGGAVTVEAATSAGFIYGAQAVAEGAFTSGDIEKPDFNLRGSTLCLMNSGYNATLRPELYPWFYDKELMTRTLDLFAEARLNTVYLWAGHMFPYLVEMPKYPDAASDVPPEQIAANQAQFRWFTNECEKRNIKVLLHFYNIHVSKPFAKKHKTKGYGGDGTHIQVPTPFLKEYYRYALSRYFEEFASVGLYACPGESIHSKYQLEWFRDVIFKAAKDSGKNPVIIVRDWTMNMDFRDNIKNLYDNVYTELKHNDESFSSPYPDLRHMQLEGVAPGHIVNFHLVSDLVPMRWGSPRMMQETMRHLKQLGFVTGVEFFGQTFWQWPYTLDKLEPSQSGYKPKGPKLLSIERDAIYYDVFGRYLWQVDRDAEDEKQYWTGYLAEKFGSREVGEWLYQWYVTTGPISPGLRNMNGTKVSGWWAAVMLQNQRLGQILGYNKSLEETPYTLYRETGRAQQRYYTRPFDDFFYERYKETYNEPRPGALPAMYEEMAAYKERLQVDDLEQRHTMPVTQYAKRLEAGLPVDLALAPEKVAALLHTLAVESVELAENAVKAGEQTKLPAAKQEELQRFLTDSQMYALATEAMVHKQQAAILQARILVSEDLAQAEAETFVEHMEQSVAAYRKLAALTGKTYLYGNDLRKTHWNRAGIRDFQADLNHQKNWIAKFALKGELEEDELTQQRDDLNLAVSVLAEWMTGPWNFGTKYPGFEGKSFRAPILKEKEPLHARIKLHTEGQYEVEVSSLVGGAHPSRALVVEVNGKKLKATHTGDGPSEGEYVTEIAGILTLPAGETDVKLYAVEGSIPVFDRITLLPLVE